MIDIKELRAGCHVLFNDERVKVCSIADINPFEPGVLVKSSKQKSLWKTTPESLDPIPITEELLKELGFEYRKDWNRYNRKYYLGKNDIGEDTYYEITTNYWNGKWIISIFHYYIMLETILLSSVKYLHELENFVFMTTKKELI